MVTFTAPSYATDNNQTQPDEPNLSATAFKLLLDQVGIDITTWINAFLLELEDQTGTKGAYGVGFDGTDTNVGDALNTIIAAGSGSIPPDGTITRPKMETNFLDDIDDNPIVPSSGASTTMLISTPGTNKKIINLQIDSDVTGGAITINRNGAGAKPLEDGEGNAIEDLAANIKYYSVVEEASQYVLTGSAPFKGYKNVQYYTSAAASSSLVVSSAKGTILSITFDTLPSANSNGTLNSLIVDSVDSGLTALVMAKGDTDGTGNVNIEAELRFEDNFTIGFSNVGGSVIHVLYALD